ncbi:MAG TPA: GNAT family N-acetyltransferase [Rhizomicrobium sp.]|nr:GNAT family N-acetyltransferase [Rhizomicrobium sp.]
MDMLRTPGPADLDALLALSNVHEREIGAIAKPAFEELVFMSFRTRMTEAGDAFLIALADRAPEVAPNYHWFAGRFDRFVYIDRVVVAAASRKRGLATLLYRDLIDASRRAGHTRLCCEVNSDPPNPASDAFHATFGFEEIGRAYLPDRGKTVRYLTLTLRGECPRSTARLCP